MMRDFLMAVVNGTDGRSDTAETIVIAVLSSSVVGGIVSMMGKKVKSPESENDLAKLGNEFAHQMLEEARTERNELRLTIRELETAVVDSEKAINRLKSLLEEKDHKIQELEEAQLMLAQKLQANEPITLRDIFGDKAPHDVPLTHHSEDPV